MRILVLDDSSDALVVVGSFLRSLDHEVHAFTSGSEALLWINDVKPELIIADLDMPIMDGFDFIKRVRHLSAYTNVPMICLTGTDATDEQIGAHGFTATLRKPITLSDVMVAIEEVTTGLKTAD